MSASIYWKPKGIREGHIEVWAPSSFLELMERAFGQQYPWTLGPEHLPVLRGMAACCESGPGHPALNPFEQIIGKIENGDEPRDIEVWPEY